MWYSFVEQTIAVHATGNYKVVLVRSTAKPIDSASVGIGLYEACSLLSK